MTDHDQPEDLQKAMWGTGNTGQYTGQNASGVKNTSLEDDEAEKKKKAKEDRERTKQVTPASTGLSQEDWRQVDQVATETQNALHEAKGNTGEIKEAYRHSGSKLTPQQNEAMHNSYRNEFKTAEAGKPEEEIAKDRAEVKPPIPDDVNHGSSDYKPFSAEISENDIDRYDRRHEETIPATTIDEMLSSEKRAYEERRRREIEEGRKDVVEGKSPLTEGAGTEKKESVIEDRTGTSPDMKDPDLMYRHMEKVGSAIAQAAAEMGGQMVSRGWDLAGDIVRMTFTQPHAMSSTSRMIGTAMGSLEMAGDFADRAAQKYGINLQQDPELMKDTIKYKLYKREAQQANGVVGNTFRAIAGSLDKMGVQDISQMTPDQLSQHVADMRQEAARLSNIIAQDKANTQLGKRQNRLSSQDRALVYAQAKHLQSYMDQLSKQGATMAADQRAMARQQRQASRQQRLQAQSTLANGQANPYQQILQWADPNANWEIDGTTGMPTKAGTYNIMLRTLRDKRAQEIRASGGLSPERQKWYDDMDAKLMEHKNLVDNEARRAPLRPYGNVFVGISDYAPGIRSHLPRILKHGDWSSLQFTRNIRGYLAGIVGRGGSSPEYRHARALLLSLDLSTKTRALRTSIGTIDPRAMERARLFHDKEGDPYRGHPFDAVEAEYDEAELGKAYEKFNSMIPKDINGAQRFNPEDPAFRQALNDYQAKMREYKDKWFPLRDKSKDDDPVDNEDIDTGKGTGGSPKKVRTGGKKRTATNVIPGAVPATPRTGRTRAAQFNKLFKNKSDARRFASKYLDGYERIKDEATYNHLRDVFASQGIDPQLFEDRFGGFKPLSMLPVEERVQVKMGYVTDRGNLTNKLLRKMFRDHPGSAELMDKFIDGTLTDEENNRLYDIVVSMGLPVGGSSEPKTPVVETPLTETKETVEEKDEPEFLSDGRRNWKAMPLTTGDEAHDEEVAKKVYDALGEYPKSTLYQILQQVNKRSDKVKFTDVGQMLDAFSRFQSMDENDPLYDQDMYLETKDRAVDDPTYQASLAASRIGMVRPQLEKMGVWDDLVGKPTPQPQTETEAPQGPEVKDNEFGFSIKDYMGNDTAPDQTDMDIVNGWLEQASSEDPAVRREGVEALMSHVASDNPELLRKLSMEALKLGSEQGYLALGKSFIGTDPRRAAALFEAGAMVGTGGGSHNTAAYTMLKNAMTRDLGMSEEDFKKWYAQERAKYNMGHSTVQDQADRNARLYEDFLGENGVFSENFRGSWEPQTPVAEEGTGEPEDEKAQYIKDHLDEGISTVRMAPEDMKETIEGFKDPETAKGYERELEDIADEFGMESITPETIGDAWSSNSLYGWDKEGENLFRAMEILMSKAYAEGGEAAYQEVLNRMGASIAGARFDEDRIRSGWAGLDDGEIKSRRDAKVSEIYNSRNKRMLLRAWERGDRAAILNNPSVLERYGLEIQGDQLVPKTTQPAPPTAETETPKGPEEVIDEATPGAEEAPEKKPKELEPAEKEKVDSIREHMGFKENEDGFRKYIDDTIKKVNSSFKSESAVKNNVLTIYGDGSKEFWKRFMKQVEADKKELPADLVTADLLKKALVPYIQMEAKQGRLENVSENKTKEERIQKIGERKQRIADDTEGLHAVSDQIRSTRDEREQHTQAFEGKEKENPLPELFNKKGKRVDYSRGGLWDGIIEFTKGMSGMSPEERAASIGDVKAYNEELQKRFDEAAERLRDPDYVNKLAQGEYERRTKRLRAEAESQIKTAMAEAQKRAQKKIMEFEAKMEEDPTYRGKGHITKVKNALKRELRDIAKNGQADFKLKMNTLEKDMVQLKHDLQVGVNNEISALERAGGKWSEYTKDLVDQPAGLRTQLQRVKVDELEKETPETVENKEYKTLDPQEYVEQFRASPDNTSYESIVNNIKAAVKERYPDAESDVLDNKVRGYTKQVDALRPNTWESGSLNSEDAGHAASSFNPESPDYKAQQKAKAKARSTLDELIGILNGDEDMGDPREVVAKARKVAQGYFTGENDTKQIDDALAAYYIKFPQYKPKLGNEELFKQYQDQINAAQSISPIMEGNITHDVRLSQEQRTQLEELIKERKGKSTPKRPTPPVEEAAPNGVNPFGDYDNMEGFYEGLEEDIRLAGKIDEIDKQRFETALNSLSDPAEKKKWRNRFAILTSDIDTAQRQQSEKDKDDERLKGFDNIESYVKDFEDGNREATVITKEELAHIRNAINTDPDLNQEEKEAYLRRIQAVEDHVNRTKRLMDMVPLASYNTIYEMVDAIENKDWYALMDLMDPRDFDEVDDPSERITLFEDFLDDTGVSDSDKTNAIAILRPALKGRYSEDPRPKSFREIMRERNPDWE